MTIRLVKNVVTAIKKLFWHLSNDITLAITPNTIDNVFILVIVDTMIS